MLKISCDTTQSYLLLYVGQVCCDAEVLLKMEIFFVCELTGMPWVGVLACVVSFRQYRVCSTLCVNVRLCAIVELICMTLHLICHNLSVICIFSQKTTTEIKKRTSVSFSGSFHICLALCEYTVTFPHTYSYYKTVTYCSETFTGL